MNPTPRRGERALWFLVMVPYLIGGYFLLGRYNLDRSYAFDPSLPFEAHIPFVPTAIFAYALVYVVLLVGFLVIPRGDDAFFRRAAIWLGANVTIAFVTFVAVPVVAVHRPEVVPDGSVAMAFTHWYFAVDAPTNLLPSLHVQMATIGGLLCWRRGGWLGWVAMATAAVIAVSVVLVKQHYVADIIAALVVVWGTARWLGLDFSRPSAAAG